MDLSQLRKQKKSPHGDKDERHRFETERTGCGFILCASGFLPEEFLFLPSCFPFSKYSFIRETVSYGYGKKRIAPFLCGKT